MTNNQIRGTQGENAASDFLLAKGYKIIARNYRYKRAEIDIIAQLDNLLVFAEVKWRRSDNFGFPEEAVSERKRELFLEAAEHYIEETGWQHDLRFDIIAITKNNSGQYLYHIEDAFHWGQPPLSPP